MENEITNDEFQRKLEEIEEFAWRWKNHKKMLKIIYNSNVETEIVKRWESQIDECFRQKIKSKL
tara:strand:- start:222 stop:413 length:192 start_codon:yes stop_codon:yes gene_type:complete